jgi:DNA polymerase (family X)
MTNDEIIDTLELTAKLMELHNENPFKTKAISNAAFKLSKLRFDFQGKTLQELENTEGIGKSIGAKIAEMLHTGKSTDFEDMMAKTPEGILEILGVKGLGPKKVRQLWQELNIESIGELLYACNENRLTALKGFGEKTQTQVKLNIEFKLANNNKFHYASLEEPVAQLVQFIQTHQQGILISVIGEMARKCEVIERIDILISEPLAIDTLSLESKIPLKINYTICETNTFYLKSVELSSTNTHLEKINFSSITTQSYLSEEEVYQGLGLPMIIAELREGLQEVDLAKQNKLPTLIEYNDLKGTLHNHTTYSDGVHTLKEMADYCEKIGLSYLGICDHSKTAVYANGLTIEKVIEQQEEIDKLNVNNPNFRILKGIESDILGDGSLDYPEEILKTFDFIVASIHSNLKMNEEKATERLIKAIENPYTSILGHPTGRLLLARPGYPINHKKVIDACAANKVSIELNAHPYRLDIDWRWIPYCLEKGVMISINPDAHHKEGFHDMYYGVCAARKGMLNKENCLNALDIEQLINQFKK